MLTDLYKARQAIELALKAQDPLIQTALVVSAQKPHRECHPLGSKTSPQFSAGTAVILPRRALP